MNKIIIILLIVLIILILLNNVKSNTTTVTINSSQPSCTKTLYGCCPNMVDSKIDAVGSNCVIQSKKSVPGYPVVPTPVKYIRH